LSKSHESRLHLHAERLGGIVLEGDGSIVDEDVDAAVVLLHEVAKPRKMV
jgi:hypothetical protein